jgi:hypothetical protein
MSLLQSRRCVLPALWFACSRSYKRAREGEGSQVSRMYAWGVCVLSCAWTMRVQRACRMRSQVLPFIVQGRRLGVHGALGGRRGKEEKEKQKESSGSRPPWQRNFPPQTGPGDGSRRRGSLPIPSYHRCNSARLPTQPWCSVSSWRGAWLATWPPTSLVGVVRSLGGTVLVRPALLPP